MMPVVSSIMKYGIPPSVTLSSLYLIASCKYDALLENFLSWNWRQGLYGAVTQPLHVTYEFSLIQCRALGLFSTHQKQDLKTEWAYLWWQKTIAYLGVLSCNLQYGVSHRESVHYGLRVCGRWGELGSCCITCHSNHHWCCHLQLWVLTVIGYDIQLKTAQKYCEYLLKR